MARLNRIVEIVFRRLCRRALYKVPLRPTLQEAPCCALGLHYQKHDVEMACGEGPRSTPQRASRSGLMGIARGSAQRGRCVTAPGPTFPTGPRAICGGQDLPNWLPPLSTFATPRGSCWEEGPEAVVRPRLGVAGLA
jgi:hypothetical protein